MKSRLEAAMTDRASFEREIRAFPSQFRTHEVFRDFCEAVSASFANAGAIKDEAWQAREDRYAAVQRKYGEEFERFPALLGVLINALENSRDESGAMDDVLGLTFERLDLSNHFAGQYFTPLCVSELMAQMTLCDAKSILDDKPFISILEPAAGCGRTLLAAVNVLRRNGLDPSSCVRVTAVDIDPLCVAMTHITLSLAGVPAIVIHGNSLTCEEWSRVTTPLWRIRGGTSPAASTVFAAVHAKHAESGADRSSVETTEHVPTPAPEPKPCPSRPTQLILF